MHWHDHLEIALVLEGRGRFLFGRRAQPAEPGDMFFIDNSQPHVALADRADSLRLLLVLFRPSCIAGPGCRALDLGYLAPFRVDERTLSADRVAGGTALGAALAPVSPGSPRPGIATTRPIATCSTPRCDGCLALVIRDRIEGGVADRAAADRREQIRPVLAYVEATAASSSASTTSPTWST